MFSRRHWIPPWGLLFAQLCHGLSWVLALWIALRVGVTGVSLPEIAWVHLVALGWFTIAALSILLHAIPSFVDVEWRYESAARGAIAVAAASIAAMVVALLAVPSAIGWSASALAGAMFVYLVTAFATLARAYRSPERVARAVARAFGGSFAVFAVVVALGALMAWMLSGAAVPPWVAQLPRAHANLALFGWLTLLIFGVSARTLRPIAGDRSRFPLLHIVYGTAMLLGAPVLAVGTALPNAAVAWTGGALIALAATCYIADVADVLLRATVPHRPPQAFVALGLVWLAVAVFVGAGVLAGAPWQSAFAFVLLAGWVAHMVNAHMLHIGVRLISTVYRGEDDDTRPEELLDARLSWFVFACMQVAVAAIGSGLLLGNGDACAAGAAAGIVGWGAMIAAFVRARARAQALPIV
jgi:hypothetical protein